VRYRLADGLAVYQANLDADADAEFEVAVELDSLFPTMGDLIL